MTRLRAGAAAAALVVAVTVSACGAGRTPALGTSSDPCFHALPAASDAVADRGTFVGVRLVNVARIRRLPQKGLTGLSRVCVVAFRGSFAPGQVERPVDNHSGRYALVAVSTDGKRVLGTLVLDRLPLALRHL